MPQSSRKWFLIAGVILIAAGVGLVAKRFFAPAAKTDAVGMASYMPGRDAAVLFVDVTALRSSGILEKLAASSVVEEAEYKTFVEQTGFDYKRDLDRLMANSADDTHYFLLDGRFDWSKLTAYAKGQGGVCEGDFCSVKGTTPGRIISFYPVTSNLLALASSSNAQAAREISSRTPVMPVYGTPSQPLWLHVPASTLHRQTELPSGTKLFTRALKPAERALFSVGPQGEQFELTADIVCRTVEQAVVMKNQLEGITQLLQTFLVREKQNPSTADLSGVLSSGSFQRQSEHVIGRWPITRAFIASLGK